MSADLELKTFLGLTKSAECEKEDAKKKKDKKKPWETDRSRYLASVSSEGECSCDKQAGAVDLIGNIIKAIRGGARSVKGPAQAAPTALPGVKALPSKVQTMRAGERVVRPITKSDAVVPGVHPSKGPAVEAVPTGSKVDRARAAVGRHPAAAGGAAVAGTGLAANSIAGSLDANSTANLAAAEGASKGISGKPNMPEGMDLAGLYGKYLKPYLPESTAGKLMLGGGLVATPFLLNALLGSGSDEEEEKKRRRRAVAY
jgi:hypothetical protein